MTAAQAQREREFHARHIDGNEPITGPHAPAPTGWRAWADALAMFGAMFAVPVAVALLGEIR